MKMRKIDTAVVLGATGFIGKYLVADLMKKEIPVMAIVRKGSEKKLGIFHNKLMKLMIVDNDLNCTLQSIPSLENAVCFNLFWQGVTGTDRSNYEKQLDNVRISLDIMRILSQKGCRVFIGASSISELDVALHGSMDGIKLPGRYMYATAKLAMNYMCRIESGLLNVDYINAVIGNVYGEYGDDNLLLHNTIVKLLKQEETAFTEAEQWYDFVYIKDVANALILLAYYGRGAVSYYIGSGKERTLKEYLTNIGKKIDEKAVLGFGKIKSDGYSMPRETFDISKIREDAGYGPRNDFERNIDRVIAYYRKKLGE